MCCRLPLASGSGVTSETTLFQQARAGCRFCLDRLMRRHDGLVQVIVRRQVLGELPFTEALQAGRIGLWRAIVGYDPGRGYAFSSYAWPAITRQVWRAAKIVRDADADSVSQWLLTQYPFATSSTNDSADPAAILESSVIGSALHDLVGRLPERLQTIIIARYGLPGQHPATYRHIGATLGLSGERVRQLHTEPLVPVATG